ncbi:hypothetical protein TCON_2332 [Astathelohania contejeani]|uniref:Uncharacterized protein n=1 Tax=Astathelohania contejeani TaxID=164912 RepID=A0ABQ7HWE1_9MICR|nr:hypothetical protein TCON_2332 [Thelohania contejeani]
MIMVISIFVLFLSVFIECNGKFEPRENLYAVYNPSVILVNPIYNLYALTIFPDDRLGDTMFVGLAELNEKNIPNQVFRAYYKKLGMNFWMSLEADKDIRIITNGVSLQARRGPQVDEKKIKSIFDSSIMKYVTIRNEKNECLTVETTKNPYHDSYPLKFRPCVKGKLLQQFGFVSKMKAICSLPKKQFCPNNGMDIGPAEATVIRYITEFTLLPNDDIDMRFSSDLKNKILI